MYQPRGVILGAEIWHCNDMANEHIADDAGFLGQGYDGAKSSWGKQEQHARDRVEARHLDSRPRTGRRNGVLSNILQLRHVH